MQNKILITILMIFSALFGGAATELTDDKINIPILEKDMATSIDEQQCTPSIVIAYTDNAKYICECVGPDCPCKKTEEILSNLG